MVLVLVALLAAGAWWWRGRSQPGPSGGGGGSAALHTGSGGGTAGTGASGRDAARRARLEGRVRGPGDAAVAAVIHVDPAGDEPTTIVAGADGRFVVEDLAPGRCTVSAAAVGFVPDLEPEVILRAGETARVELVLAAGGVTLRGTVSDASSGPIAGATVTASVRQGFFGDAPDGAAALTDDGGRYALTLAAGTYRVRASHAEYVGAAAAIELRDVEVIHDFRLVPGGVIEGVVKDEVTGQPVAGAEVTVERDRGGAGWAEGRTMVTVESDATGAFRAPGLMPGTLRVGAEVPRDGRMSREPVLVPLGVAEQAAGIEVFVGAAPYIAGRVVDEQGAPVPEAMVMAIGKQQMTSSQSDGDGVFRFVGLEPGTWQLAATSAHHQAGAMVPVTLADKPVTGVEVKVASAPHIIGRVEPPGVAEVRIDHDLSTGTMMLWGAGGATSMAATHSGEDGRFDLTPVESGKQRLVAKAADGRRGKVEVVVPEKGAAEVVIELEELGSIAGTVFDQHARPVPGAVVHVKKTEAGKRSSFVINGVDQSADRAAVDKGGNFVMRGLVAGRYELTVVDERGGRLLWAGGASGRRGSDRAPVVVILAEHKQQTGIRLAVELDDGVIRGVVKNPDGTARALAWVTASLRHDELVPDRPGGDEDVSEVSTTVMIVDDGSGVGGAVPVLTDEQGRFEISGLRRGAYDLVAEAERGALRGKVENIRTGGEATITMAGLASIEGVVTAGGKPATEFSFELEGVARRAQTVRDAGGRFRIERIDPGTYTVRVKSKAGVGNATVTAEAGKTAQVAIALASATKVRGRLIDAAGQPVAERAVLAMPARPDGEHGSFSYEGAPPQSGPDGRFELEVEAGEYQLLVLGGGGPTGPGKRFTAVSGQTVDLGDVNVPKPAPPAPSPPAQ